MRKDNFEGRYTCKPEFLAFRISCSRLFAVLQWLAIQEAVTFGDFMFHIKSRSSIESEKLISWVLSYCSLTIFSKSSIGYNNIRASFIRHGPIDSIRSIEYRLICWTLMAEYYVYCIAPALHHLGEKVSIVIQPSVSFFASVGVCRKMAIFLILVIQMKTTRVPLSPVSTSRW